MIIFLSDAIFSISFLFLLPMLPIIMLCPSLIFSICLKFSILAGIFPFVINLSFPFLNPILTFVICPFLFSLILLCLPLALLHFLFFFVNPNLAFFIQLVRKNLLVIFSSHWLFQ